MLIKKYIQPSLFTESLLECTKIFDTVFVLTKYKLKLLGYLFSVLNI